MHQNANSPASKKVHPYEYIKKEDYKPNPECEDMFLDGEEGKIQADWKANPLWDISYKQQVTASDVFLQVFSKLIHTINNRHLQK